jgi:1,4-dihydroxy-2-naphthoate polyprenyltransferase
MNERRTIGVSLGLWWKAVRPYAYPASIMPALLGTALAWMQGYEINFGRAALVFIGVIAAHTGGNLINDVEDVARGVDRPDTLGGNGLLVAGKMTSRETFRGAIVALLIAAACGIALIISGGWPILLLMLMGGLAAVGYGVAPFSFKYRAFGNPIVFLSFGVGIVLGAYMVQAGSFSWSAVVAAIPMGLLVSGILIINNLRDIEDDRVSGILTFEGRLGAKQGGAFYTLVLAGAYVTAIVSVIVGLLPAGALAMLVTIPLALPLALRARTASIVGPSFLKGAPEHAAQLMLAFGVTMTLGMCIQVALLGFLGTPSP